MAARGGLRGRGVARRQLRLDRDRGLLLHARGTSDYGSYVKFDHDFVGREALERIGRRASIWQKVTLALDDEDVTRTIGTMFRESDRAKFMRLARRRVLDAPVRRRSSSTARPSASRPGSRTARTRARVLTLAVLDAEYAEPGTEVTFVWGEEDGGDDQAHRRSSTCRPRSPRGREPGPVRRGGANVVLRRAAGGPPRKDTVRT